MKELSTEEKDLLLVDLCARLPYGVFVKEKNRSTPIKCDLECHPNLDDLEKVKPYLRPMSSMTEKEKAEFLSLPMKAYSMNSFDWLNAHHFDYRGLIEKGLALEAPKGMYNLKEQ